MTMTEKTIHEGRNVKRIREILGIKQETLAIELGISQQAISALEQKEALDKDMLEKVAKALKIPSEAIKNFNEETVISNIQHNNDGATLNYSPNYQYNHQPVFNSIEKYIELFEKNEKLYTSLLNAEREKIALLEKLLDKK